jgi:GR25 family glycosyltransferase involved in LPS biosynthesis
MSRSLPPGLTAAHVINLDARPDRLATFHAAHATLAASRWPAVDGRALSLTPELAHLFRRNNYGWKKSVMGCALSHLGLWRRCAAEADEGARYLIMEDDCVLLPGWERAWAQLAPGLPADTDVVYLGGVIPPNRHALPLVAEQVAPGLARVRAAPGSGSRHFHFCNYSYVLTRKGARTLLAIVEQMGMALAADHMIGAFWQHLRIYFAWPLLSQCTQDSDPAYVGADFDAPSWQHTYDSNLRNNSDAFAPAEYELLLKVASVAASAPAVPHPHPPAQ